MMNDHNDDGYSSLYTRHDSQCADHYRMSMSLTSQQTYQPGPPPPQITGTCLGTALLLLLN